MNDPLHIEFGFLSPIASALIGAVAALVASYFQSGRNKKLDLMMKEIEIAQQLQEQSGMRLAKILSSQESLATPLGDSDGNADQFAIEVIMGMQLDIMRLSALLDHQSMSIIKSRVKRNDLSHRDVAELHIFISEVAGQVASTYKKKIGLDLISIDVASRGANGYAAERKWFRQ